MKRKKGKKLFLFWGLGFVLLLFTSVSILHLQKSFFVYRAAQERLKSTHNEKTYVEAQLENLQTHTQKQMYDSENTGTTAVDRLKKIELRGVELSPNKNKPFSKNEIRFNVIEQE